MRSWFVRSLVVLTVAVLSVGTSPAQKPSPVSSTTLPELADYRTVEKAVTTRISNSLGGKIGQAGYLGVHVQLDARGKLLLDQVGPDSPAAKAGLRPGDVLVQIEGQPVTSNEKLRQLLMEKSPGQAIKVKVERQDKPVEVTATLGATSRPMDLTTQRVSLGIFTGEPAPGEEGPTVRGVQPGSAAAEAGIKSGDMLLKLDSQVIAAEFRVNEAVVDRKPGDVVVLTVRRDGKPLEVKVTLKEDQGGGRMGGWDSNRMLTPWKKDVYRLAVICIEYPDAKHNPAITSRDWEHSLFSRNAYNGKSVTGQQVFGSLNDYYQEQSFGKLRVDGKVFDFVEVSKKRMDYSQGTASGAGARSPLLSEAVEKLLAREGKDALKDFDGIYFVYAGGRVQTTRGGLYWPHRSTFSHGGKRWPYFICPEGGDRMNSISVICHEFGHMLGLPDLYARPENPGSEGLGIWCAMSNQAGNGKPQHFCAWAKEKLGWVQPVVIDPTVKQKLILAPIEDSPKECVKVLVRPDGSEFLLLENRRKKGFDESLPAEGLLIWRVVNNRPILEESHGVDGPPGPRVFVNAVPYPSPANDAFTPFTTPSSRAQLGGGLPVHITNIRRLPDGRITFHIGYEYQ